MLICIYLIKIVKYYYNLIIFFCFNVFYYIICSCYRKADFLAALVNKK